MKCPCKRQHSLEWMDWGGSVPSRSLPKPCGGRLNRQQTSSSSETTSRDLSSWLGGSQQHLQAGLPGVNLPELPAHPVVPHRDQALLASTDDLPVVHLDCGHSELVGGDGQGDAVSAEVVDPHPAGPEVSRELALEPEVTDSSSSVHSNPVKMKNMKHLNIHLCGALSQEATGH